MQELLSVLESFVNLAEQHENAEIEKLRICSATALEQLNIWVQFQNQQTALANEAAFRSQALFHLGSIVNALEQETATLLVILGRQWDSWSPDLSAAGLEKFTTTANLLLGQISTRTQVLAQIGGQFAISANWGPSSLAPQGYYYAPPPMMQSYYAYTPQASAWQYAYPYVQQFPNSPTGHL